MKTPLPGYVSEPSPLTPSFGFFIYIDTFKSGDIIKVYGIYRIYGKEFSNSMFITDCYYNEKILIK